MQGTCLHLSGLCKGLWRMPNVCKTELGYGNGYFRVCEVEPGDKFKNPVVTIFLNKLLAK